jgi:hypothetical protein
VAVSDIVAWHERTAGKYAEVLLSTLLTQSLDQVCS